MTAAADRSMKRLFRLRIGLTVRIFRPEPGSGDRKTKTFLTLEQTVAQWAIVRAVQTP